MDVQLHTVFSTVSPVLAGLADWERAMRGAQAAACRSHTVLALAGHWEALALLAGDARSTRH